MPSPFTVAFTSSEAWVTYQALIAAKDDAEKRLVGFDGQRNPGGFELATLRLAAIERALARMATAADHVTGS